MNPISTAKLKNRMKFICAGTMVVIATAVTATLVGCSSARETVSAAPETVSNVAVISAQSAKIPDLVEAVGTLRASQTSQLAAQMMGNLVEIRVHEGDIVRRGQILAVIDEGQPRAAFDHATAADLASQQQIAAAESELTLAESTFKRYQTLYERKSVSPQEFDEVKARYQTAQGAARHGSLRAGSGQGSPPAGTHGARIYPRPGSI